MSLIMYVMYLEYADKTAGSYEHDGDNDDN
jgi:hypothetical protein